MLENKQSYNISDFCTIECNEEFVLYAYAALLGRIADKAGYEECLGRLNRLEASRGDILLELLASEEGRKRGVTVDGIKLANYPRIRRLLIPILLRVGFLKKQSMW